MSVKKFESLFVWLPAICLLINCMHRWVMLGRSSPTQRNDLLVTSLLKPLRFHCRRGLKTKARRLRLMLEPVQTQIQRTFAPLLDPWGPFRWRHRDVPEPTGAALLRCPAATAQPAPDCSDWALRLRVFKQGCLMRNDDNDYDGHDGDGCG